MRYWRQLLLLLALLYVVISAVGAIIFAEVSLHPQRSPLKWGLHVADTITLQHHIPVLDISITAHGVELKGWYIKPETDNGNVVLLLHGLSDNRIGVAGYALLFLEHGYRVLLPDVRAHGESGGDIATFGLQERHDVREWLNWLYTEDPPQCVFGFGESMGAAITLQALAVESRFCAVAVESPFASFPEIAYERAGRALGLGPWFGRTLGRPMIELAFAYGKLRYGVDFGEASPEDTITQSAIPVLLIHGDADRNILPINSEKLHRLSARHSELWIVPEAEHGGAWTTQPSEFERRVLDWFARHSPNPAVAVP